MKILSLAIINLLIFSCLSGQERLIDSRDGNIYETITIHGITWMAENLKFKVDGGTHMFDNTFDNLKRYGLLYEWRAALQACPAGWHLPSGSEFQILAGHFGFNDLWRKGESDQSYFIQLGGMQDYEGTFSEMDESGYYWTSTEYDKGNAEYFSYLIINKMPVIDISRKADIEEIPGTEKANKYSVRCVRN
jgi:uncharacterized protein (TIGR02145 family)